MHGVWSHLVQLALQDGNLKRSFASLWCPLLRNSCRPDRSRCHRTHKGGCAVELGTGHTQRHPLSRPCLCIVPADNCGHLCSACRNRHGVCSALQVVVCCNIRFGCFVDVGVGGLFSGLLRCSSCVSVSSSEWGSSCSPHQGPTAVVTNACRSVFNACYQMRMEVIRIEICAAGLLRCSNRHAETTACSVRHHRCQSCNDAAHETIIHPASLKAGYIKIGALSHL